VEAIRELSKYIKTERPSATNTIRKCLPIEQPITDTVCLSGQNTKTSFLKRGDRLIQLIDGLNINFQQTIQQLAHKMTKPAITVNSDFKMFCSRIFGEVPHKTRIKNPTSLAPKIQTRLTPENYTMKEAMKTVTDLQGGMGITNGTKEESNAIVKKIIKELLNGNIRQITSVENYHSPNIQPYFSELNMKQLQMAQKKKGLPIEKVKNGEKAHTKNGYPGAHITGITKEGLPFELQIKGKFASKIDPATHIIHDLETGKDSLRSYPSANGRKLLKPVISAFDSLNPAQKKVYNEYIRTCYCVAREGELLNTEFFIPSLPKILPAELSIENLNKVAEQLK